jgi:SAM-dependent methyltransferase
MSGHLREAVAFWDREATAPRSGRYWADYPIVRNYVNQCATDAWWAYPAHAFKAGWAYRPLATGLSLGCGTGALERTLRWLRVCESIDAYDISPASIEIARATADAEGVDGVEYRVEDCDALELPHEQYDAAFFSGSMHHMRDPDGLLRRVAASLKPRGLVYVDDYVGPSRDEWSETHLVHARAAFDRLPDAVKAYPLAAPYDSTDPSEMVQSGRILPALREQFDIVWERPYWGNVLYPVLCHVDHEEMARPANESLLRELIETERSLVASKKITEPLFAWIVARKR